jgi:Sulfotransferase domain
MTDLSSGRLLLPDFVVIGAPKCGTHWLNECLREHPEVYLTPDVHEIFFFDRYFDRGVEWYARYFRGYGGQRRVGDVTPTYLAHPLAAERVQQVLPRATLLVSLRNPIQRAWSKYLHMWRKGDLPRDRSFRDACASAPEILGDGEYLRCLEPWRRRFPAAQLNYLVVDDLKRDPAAYLRRVYEILGVDPEFRAATTSQRANEHQTPRSHGLAKAAFRVSRLLHSRGLHRAVEVGKRVGVKWVVLKDGRDPRRDPPPPTPDERAWLASHYRDDVAALSAVVGRDLQRLWLRQEARAPGTPSQ